MFQTKEQNRLFDVEYIVDIDAINGVGSAGAINDIYYISEIMRHPLGLCRVQVGLDRERHLSDISNRFSSVSIVNEQFTSIRDWLFRLGNTLPGEYLPELLHEYRGSEYTDARCHDVPKLVLSMALNETFGCSIVENKGICERCGFEDPYVSFSKVHKEHLCWKCCGE